jgi:hypothetical protein
VNKHYLQTWKYLYSLFSLFHENVELTRFIRRMLLSWLINMKKNDETLKNIKIDIWFKLIIVHRDLITIKRSFSEFFNHYEMISYRFLSTVEIKCNFLPFKIIQFFDVCKSRYLLKSRDENDKNRSKMKTQSY